MYRVFTFYIILTKVALVFHSVNCETYTVKISTDKHINVVDNRFLSFTIDPEYLFTSDEKYSNKECVCMASALTPAFIRIAGPSTSHLTFKNTSITITPDLDLDQIYATKKPPLFHKLGDIFSEDEKAHVKRSNELSVSHKQWRKFVQWSNQTGFDLVFALNNQEKLDSGVWDPNSALSILSVADKAGVENIVWQLGYECTNQSIDDYLYDLETLKIMVETFPRRSSGDWKVVGGDASPCLQSDSKSDFKDFVTLSNDRLDAILLDGNSAMKEIEKMSSRDRLKLLRVLSYSETPLWITESQDPEDLIDYVEELRAADWMMSLGHSARNGFSVHFRELKEDELFQPSLSFYMALLYKNLVGERVLNAEFDSPSNKASLFAHCTSLRHKTVPGAVTIFGANMDDEPARFSIKLLKREEGGDIMQFILGLDKGGNIVVNGRPMYYEGDIRPIIKRVRPYKTLLISLPPKTFGFWVLANTNIEACSENKKHYEDNQIIKPTAVEEDKFESDNLVRTKRSDYYTDIEYPDFVDFYDEQLVLNAKEQVAKYTERDVLNDRVNKKNKDFKRLRNLSKREERTSDNSVDVENKINEINRIKRQIDDSFQDERIQNKLRRPLIQRKPFIFKSRDSKILGVAQKQNDSKSKEGLLFKIRRFNEILNETRQLRAERTKQMGLKLPFIKNKVSKRDSKKQMKKFEKQEQNRKVLEELENWKIVQKKNQGIHLEENLESKKLQNDKIIHSRKQRSILKENKKSIEESQENEIDTEGVEFRKFGKILHKIDQQLQKLPGKLEESKNLNDAEENSDAIEDEVTLKTKITDDDAFIKLSEKSNFGILKLTFNKALSVLDDLNSKLNRVMSVIPILNS